MSYDIAAKARETQANYQAALVRLSTARSAYEQGAGGAYAAAKAQRALIEGKIKEAEAEVDSAETAYHQAFAAGHFERTPVVREALARKHDAEATIAALRVALGKIAEDMQRHLIDASVQGRQYRDEYQGAYTAYVRNVAMQALAQSGEAIARALALATTVPAPGGYWEDEYEGQGALPDSALRERRANRQNGLLETLREGLQNLPARWQASIG